MSVLRVNDITSTSDGAVELTEGLIVGDGGTLTSNLSMSGVCTSTAFVGDGSSITVTGGVSNAKIFAITYIF